MRWQLKNIYNTDALIKKYIAKLLLDFCYNSICFYCNHCIVKVGIITVMLQINKELVLFFCVIGIQSFNIFKMQNGQSALSAQNKIGETIPQRIKVFSVINRKVKALFQFFLKRIKVMRIAEINSIIKVKHSKPPILRKIRKK